MTRVVSAPRRSVDVDDTARRVHRAHEADATARRRVAPGDARKSHAWARPSAMPAPSAETVSSAGPRRTGGGKNNLTHGPHGRHGRAAGTAARQAAARSPGSGHTGVCCEPADAARRRAADAASSRDPSQSRAAKNASAARFWAAFWAAVLTPCLNAKSRLLNQIC